MFLDVLPWINAICIGCVLTLLWEHEGMAKSAYFLIGAVACIIGSYFGHTFRYPSQLLLVLTFLVGTYFATKLNFLIYARRKKDLLRAYSIMPYFVFCLNIAVYMFYLLTSIGAGILLFVLILFAVSLIFLGIFKHFSRFWISGFLYPIVIYGILFLLQSFSLGYEMMLNSLTWGFIVSFGFYSLCFFAARDYQLNVPRTKIITIWIFTNFSVILWSAMYESDIAIPSGFSSYAFDSTDYVRIALLFALLGHIVGRMTATQSFSGRLTSADLKMTSKIFLVFVYKAALLWILIGILAGIICFKLTVEIEVLKNNEALKEEWSRAAMNLIALSAFLWTICGAIVGGLVYFVFTYQPLWKHTSLLSQPDGFPVSGPKTVAELHTIPIAMIISVLTCLVMRYVIMPLIDLPDFYELNPSAGPTIIVCIQAALFSVLILPFSLKMINKLVVKG